MFSLSLSMQRQWKNERMRKTNNVLIKIMAYNYSMFERNWLFFDRITLRLHFSRFFIFFFSSQVFSVYRSIFINKIDRIFLTSSNIRWHRFETFNLKKDRSNDAMIMQLVQCARFLRESEKQKEKETEGMQTKSVF